MATTATVTSADAGRDLRRDRGARGRGVVPQRLVRRRSRAPADLRARATYLTDEYVDLTASRNNPLGADLIDGFLLLSLLTYFHFKHAPLPAEGMYGFNYGLNRVRFTSPVLVGDRVRLHVRLVDAVPRRDDRLLVTTANELEVEGRDKPAMVAEWITLLGTDGAPAAPLGAEEIPDHDRLQDYLADWTAERPNATAYVFEGAETSYHELAEQVDALAKGLLASGVGPGDRVAMLSTPRPEFWVCFLATTSIGAVWVGLSPRAWRIELQHVVGNSGPTVLLSLATFEGRDYRRDVHALAAATPSVRRTVLFGPGAGSAWDDVVAGGETVGDTELATRRAAVAPDDPALIVYTSGTTGAPKGAVLSQFALAYAFRTEARLTLPEGEVRDIANLPVNHIGGVGDLCCTPLVAGGSIVFLERFDPAEVLATIERHRVTCLMQVPTILQVLVDHPEFATTDLSSLRAVYWGGAPLPLDVVRRYRALGVRLGTTYGMTEVTGSITYSDEDSTDETLAETVGRVQPELEVRLVDEGGRDVETGETGEILVRHRCLLLEYFGDPEATARSFTDDGFFRTGDIGVLLPDGNLRLVGRRTEMFKSGGENVYPREIEMCLEAHPAVRLSAVVSMPDRLYHEVGVAFVEADPDAVGGGELVAWCQDRLANYKVPKAVHIVDRLPLLEMGKVDKPRLRELMT